MREAMMFLQNYGITLNLAAKIYQEYGPKLYSIIKENPYKLADDIPGVGFKMADEIAEKQVFSRTPITVSKQAFCTSFFRHQQRPHLSSTERAVSQAADLLKVEPSAMETILWICRLTGSSGKNSSGQ